MILDVVLFDKKYEFKTVNEVLAKANEEKSGDILAGVAAESAEERVAAKVVLANLTLENLRDNPAIPYEEDEVTRIIQDDLNENIYQSMKSLTVQELREKILSYETTSDDIHKISRGLTAEMVAAVTKLMSNLDLVKGAHKITVEAHCNTTIGKKGTLSARLQPNHPTDDEEGVIASTLEGLSYGVGDAVLGFNPVDDTVESVTRMFKKLDEVKRKFDIPTQVSVLSHVTTQMEAIKQGAPVDLIFQSVAGSEKGNTAFGIDGQMIADAKELVLREGTSAGPNVMYFETGQGAELSSDAHHGVDQLTLEARCYGFSKHFAPFLVNTVVGFIGPEYLYDSKQVIRAGLEDHFMGKLSGVSMGVDVCYTNHMKADQNDMENLSALLAQSGVNFLISAPHGDDVMLNYQSLGYHDIQTLRETLNLKPIKEYEKWLQKMNILDESGKLTEKAGDASLFLA